MFCVMVVYPNKDGVQFDFEYYTKKHIPMVSGYLGANLIKVEVRQGIASISESIQPFVCVSTFRINSVEEFHSVMTEHGKEIMGDIPNYTNVEPIIQIDEVIE